MMRRVYGLFELKAADADKRTIEGIATTPNIDRMGDVVEPKGAQYTLPIPLLWQHDANQPVGHVLSAKVTKEGIFVKTRLVTAEKSETLIKRLDEAWESVKLGLVRGFSIGFKPLGDTEFINSDNNDSPFPGQRFLKWEWLELSLVTVPANADATIQVVRSIGEAQIRRNVARLAPGVVERVRNVRSGAVYSTRG